MTGVRLALLAVLVVGCAVPTPPQPKSGKNRIVGVETVAPIRDHLPVRVDLPGTVESLMKTDVCARVPGIVQYLPQHVDIGRSVAEGDLLLRLDVPDLKAQKLAKESMLNLARRQKRQAEELRRVAEKEVMEAEQVVKKFEAELAFRQIETKRITDLVARGAQQEERRQEAERQLAAAQAALAAARAGVETKKAKHAATEADVDTAEARIEVAEAEVRQLNVLIGYATVTAPISGVIARRWVDQGATVKDAGVVLFTLMHTDTVRVLIDVPERDVPRIKAAVHQKGPGNLVVFRVPALRDVVPGGEFRGTIYQTAASLDPNTRTMRVEVFIDNKAGHLRPGMYGTASVLLDQRYDALTVPSSALVRIDNKTEVFIVADPVGDPPRGVVKRVPVKIGLDDGRRVEVSEGLEGHERVIAKGNGLIREGETVRVLPAAE